jgi:hypothetical protein
MIVLSEDGYSIKSIAPPDLRDRPEFALTFWGWVTDLGLKAKDNELSRGLDRHGKPLRRISEATRLHRRSAMTPTGKGDPSAPPLTPGRQLSRTRSLLTGRAYGDHAAFWWKFDPWTGDSWARVLEAQKAMGRDVFGLSPKAEAAVKARAWAMWADLKAGRPIPVITARQATPVAIPQVGRTPTSAAVFGIGAGGRIPGPGFTGGLTRKEWEAYFRTPAKVQIPSRPGDDYNVILRHIWGVPGGPAQAVGIAVKPPKPKPVVQRVAMGPRPAPPKSPPPSYAFNTHGSLLPEDVTDIRKAIEGLPRPVLDMLSRAGVKFAYAEKFSNFDSVLASEAPRGWPAGMTWDNADGVYHPATKTILVCKTRRNYHSGDFVVSSRQIGVLRHETGHAVDFAFPGMRISNTPDFQAAHQADLDAFPDNLRDRYNYYLQSGMAGMQEVIAETFAQFYGGGALPYAIDQVFPRSAAYLSTLIKGLK